MNYTSLNDIIFNPPLSSISALVIISSFIISGRIFGKYILAKDNIITIGNGLSLINQLRGVKFDWNKGSRTGQKDIGLIAQEVEKVLPELVREKKMALIDDKEYLTVDYDKIVAVLVEAVKERQNQIENLKERLNKFD